MSDRNKWDTSNRSRRSDAGKSVDEAKKSKRKSLSSGFFNEIIDSEEAVVEKSSSKATSLYFKRGRQIAAEELSVTRIVSNQRITEMIKDAVAAYFKIEE